MNTVFMCAALRSRELRSARLFQVAVVIFTALAIYAGNQARAASPPVPTVVTADIQAGIEKHIDEQTRLGGGYFELRFNHKILRLKLVRIHMRRRCPSLENTSARSAWRRTMRDFTV
jgi:hypothetical protein